MIQVLKTDEYGNNTQWIENNVEWLAQNFYDKNGKFLDVKIYGAKFLKGFKSIWFNHDTLNEDKYYKFLADNTTIKIDKEFFETLVKNNGTIFIGDKHE